MNTRNKIFAVVGTVAILGAAGTGGYLLFATPDSATTSSTTNSSQLTTSTTPTTSTATTTTATAPSSSATTSYKDGTYTASATYAVPHGGQNTLKATIVVASGKITSVTTNHDYADRESGMYIDSFDSTLTSVVVRQSISTGSVSRVGGASLTSSAFNDALDTIRNDAQA